jgi:hypothetical protein
MSLNPFYSTEVVYRLTDILGEYTLVSKDTVPYDGLWDCCKGDNIDQEAEQNQENFDNSLMAIFQSQYATQQAQLKYLQDNMEPIIQMGGEGASTPALAAQRTAATDTNSEQYQDAQQALNEQTQANSGGSKLAGVAGSTIQANAELANAEAQQQSTSQENITAQNAALQQNSYWNAVGALNGVAAQEAPLGYASAATSGTSAVAQASQAYTASNQSQLLGALGGMASGAGAMIGGGIAKSGGSCHIFASLFGGWDSLKTHVMRAWLHTEAPAWFRVPYIKYGERISKTPFRWAFYPIGVYVLGRT